MPRIKLDELSLVVFPAGGRPFICKSTQTTRCPFRSSPRKRFATPQEERADIAALRDMLEHELGAPHDADRPTSPEEMLAIASALAEAAKRIRRNVKAIHPDAVSGDEDDE